MELIFYGQLDSQSGGYDAYKWIRCGGMCSAPWRQLNAPLEMVPMTEFGAFLITAFTTSKSGETKTILFYVYFFQLVRFTFKFELRITH